MKAFLKKTKYLLCGVICLVFACMLLPQELRAEEEPPEGSYENANLVAVDAQGVKYVFSPDDSTDTGYSTTAEISIQDVLTETGEESTADITIPSTITIGLPFTNEDDSTTYYDPTAFPITEVIRDMSAEGELIGKTDAEKISRFTFADGIQKISGCSDILNLVQDVTLSDTLTCLKDSVYGAKVSDAVENIAYPRGDVPVWVQTLADNSEDHIAYAGTVALWVDPVTERGSLTFKEGITNIAWFAAMGNTKITTATIPETVKELGDGVFYGCENLTTIDILSDSIISLPYMMFTNTSLSSIVIPASVEKIAALCFYKAGDLQTVTFEENSRCKLIDYRAFRNSGLTGIEIPAGVTEIGVEAFRNATALKSVTFAEESKCTTIPFCAFKNCPSLEAFVLPDSVTQIDSLAFMGCTGLKTFEISDNSQLRKIDDGAFGWLFYKNTDDTTGYGIPQYTAFVTPDAFALEDEAESIEFLTAPSQYGCPIEEINLPYNVSLGVGLFAGNKDLKKVTFQAKPETAESEGALTIPFKAFYGCGALESVDLNGNIAKIDTTAFTYCKSLQSVDLTGVTEVGFAAFADTGLTGELVIPESLTNVGDMSFAQCPGIDKIILNSTLEQTRYHQMFSILGQECRETITGAHMIEPYGYTMQDQYQIFSNADYRKKFPKQTAPKTIVINGVKVGEEIKSALDDSYSQGSGVLQQMAMVEEVVIGDGIREIATQTCLGCVSLRSVSLPESLEKIGVRAFYNDEQLAGIDFSKLVNLTTIGDRAFMLYRVDGNLYSGVQFTEELPANWGLDEIVLSDSVTSIGESAFWGQRNAKKISIPSEKAVIENSAFKFCNQVEEISVASANFTTRMWNEVFWNERQSCLEKVTLNGQSKTDNAPYMYGLEMEEIDLSSTGITTIYKGMLNDCMSLEKVTLGDTITTIEPIAFLRCRALKNIVLPESVEKLDIAAFAKSGLEQIVILNPQMKFMKPVAGNWNSSTYQYEVENSETETAYNGIFDLATIRNTLPVMPNVTIYGFKDSTAEAYAKEHGNRFVALDYTITFDSNGGSAVEAQNLSNRIGEETFVTEPEKPTKADAYFLGWFVKNEPETDGEEATYTKFIFDQAYDSDMTVYAQWEDMDEIPAVVPESTLSVANTVKTVGDVTSLPAGWSWNEEDALLPLTAGVGVNATAEYTAEDAAAYKTTEYEVTITRVACEAAEEILFTGEGEYAPTCIAPGLGHKECSICGDVVETEVEAPVIPHTLQHHDAEEASCIAYGAKEYWTCEMCHQMFADEDAVQTVKVSELIIDKSKHVPLPAVKENETDTSYDLVEYCEKCQSELSRVTKQKEVKQPVDTTVAVKDLKLNAAKLTLGAGESFTIVTDIIPANATNKNLAYKSSNTSVVTVIGGKITAKKKGSATITVTASNGKEATIAVTVKKKPAKVTLNVKSKTLKKGKTVTLKAKFPKGTASYKLIWTSSNKKVATVTENGKVKALKKGTAKITVKTYNGKKATCTIKVK